MSHDNRHPRFSPSWIAAAYLVFGALALVAFDVLLPRVLSPDSVLRRVQFLKGGLEVAVTAAFLFVLAWYAHRTLARANDRLQRKDEALQVLLRLLRHNVRNDVNVIRGHAESARDASADETVTDSCDVIIETTDGLLHQTETVNRLRDVLVGSTEPVTFELAAVVDDVFADVRSRREFDGTLETEEVESAVVAADRLLPVAIREIVANSIEHHDGPAPTVECTVDRHGDEAVLRIEDDGPGIPEHELTAISEGEESPLSHASGIGLWFVHWIVSGSGGDVTVQNRSDRGAVVELSLPTAGSG